MTEEQIIKALNVNNSDILDAVNFILQKQIDLEIQEAVGQFSDETQRAHSCGRVDGLISFKSLLNETHSIIVKNSNK